MKGFGLWNKKAAEPTPEESAKQAPRKGLFSGIQAAASRAAGFNTGKAQSKPQGIATSSGYVASSRQLNTTTLTEPVQTHHAPKKTQDVEDENQED